MANKPNTTKAIDAVSGGDNKPTPLPAGFEQYRPMSQLVWWLWFALASYLLSLVFQTFKVFTLDTTWGNAGLMALAIVALFLVMAWLSFDSYAKERVQGKIYHPVRLFERIYDRFYRNDFDKGVVS